MAFTRAQLQGKTVGLIKGGWSAERDVSLDSGAACAGALRKRGYQVVEIDANRDLARQLRDVNAEVVFNALHGKFGEDGCIQGLLESMGIPYTGSDVLSSAMAMDKVVSKQVFALHGLPIVPDVVAARGEYPEPPSGFPVVVKPNSEGSSVGITIVRDPAEYRLALDQACQQDARALVEQFIDGRELTVGLLDSQALGVLEIVVHSKEFYDYEAKYHVSDNDYVMPASIPDQLAESLCAVGLAAYRALRCRGPARADFVVRRDATANSGYYLLEINTLPGMTSASLLPKIAAWHGMDFGELCERILLGAACLSRIHSRKGDTA